MVLMGLVLVKQLETTHMFVICWCFIAPIYGKFVDGLVSLYQH
jgi:hypothetical protein